MTDPKITYVVWVCDTAAKVWRTILVTCSKDEAEALLADLGDKARIEEFKPGPKRKR